MKFKKHMSKWIDLGGIGQGASIRHSSPTLQLAYVTPGNATIRVHDWHRAPGMWQTAGGMRGLALKDACLDRLLRASERPRVRLLVQLPSRFEHHLWIASHGKPGTASSGADSALPSGSLQPR